MRRILWNSASALSAVLAVALLLVWARSYQRFMHAAWEHFDPVTRDWREWNLNLKQGRLTTWVARRYTVPAVVIILPPPGLQYDTRPAQAYFSPWSLGLLRVQHGRGPGAFGTTGFFEIGINLLLLTGVAMVLPIVWRVQHRRRQRLARTGHCPGCGYNLHASPAVCPECGLAAPGALPVPSPGTAGEQAKPATRQSGIR